MAATNIPGFIFVGDFPIFVGGNVVRNTPNNEAGHDDGATESLINNSTAIDIIGPRNDPEENTRLSSNWVPKLSAGQVKEFKKLEDRLQTLEGAKRDVFGKIESGSTTIASLMLVAAALATSISKIINKQIGAQWLSALLGVIFGFYSMNVVCASIMKFINLYYDLLKLEYSLDLARRNIGDFFKTIKEEHAEGVEAEGVEIIEAQHIDCLVQDTPSSHCQFAVQATLYVSILLASIASIIAIAIVTISD